MLHSTNRFFCSLLGLVFLTACIPAVAQPTTGPSRDEIEAMISTSVAQTVTAYAQTQAAVSSPTPTPFDTATAVPTLTATLVFPTLTPFPTSTPFNSGGGTLPPLSDYACAVVNKIPADNTVLKPSKDFDVKFSLRNVGAKTWAAGADLLFNSGTNMLTASTSYELPEVDPGELVGPFVFDARTPKKVGTYTMTFKVQGGFCYPYIHIIVKK